MKNSYSPTFLNLFPGHLYWFDTRGILLGCNQACSTFFGYSNPETMVGEDVYEIMKSSGVRPAHLDQMRKDNARVHQGDHVSVEEIVIKDGKEITFLSYKYPLVDDQDKIIGVIGTSLDITEQKKREGDLLKENLYACQEIKIQNLYLKNILNAQLPVSFYWMDKEGTILGCNEAQAHIYGFNSSKELIGKSTYFLRDYFGWSDEMCEAIRRNDIMVMETGKTIVKEENVRVNREERTYLSHKSPLLNDEGEIIGVFGFSADITERKMAEVALTKAMEKSEALSSAKTEFIRNMSHDIRTPLSGIIGMADMINHMPEAVATQEGVKDIREAGIALLNLLNEIIETAQLESGDIKPEKNCFALKDTIDALTAIFRPAIRQKGLTLETYYDDNIPEVLYGQDLLLHRIILNLLGNAVKFTAHGAISLEVSLSQKTSDKVSLQIVVKDTGTGIPTDKQQVIFDKFSRLTPSYTNNYKGSGLGLYMVKQFIEKLGGDIKVNSTLGNGAQFTCSVQFKIPTNAQLKKYHKFNQHGEAQSKKSIQYELDKVTNENKTTLPVQAIPTPDIGDKLHALLVEDTLLPRKAAEGLLKKEGYVVVVAETAQEALEKSKEFTFDLIYMDVGLPDGTGIDVTKAIRGDPANPNANTYIVALTAHSDDKIKRECLGSGMQEVFNKPLDSKKIEIAQTHMNDHLFSKKKIDSVVPAKKNPQEISKLPLLDLAVSLQMMGGNQSLTKEMLEMFIKQLPEFKSNISEAFNKADWSVLNHYVHKLHGGLCYSGALRLKAITHDFEVALNKNTGDYANHYNQLIQGIRDTEEEYKKIKV